MYTTAWQYSLQWLSNIQFKSDGNVGLLRIIINQYFILVMGFEQEEKYNLYSCFELTTQSKRYFLCHYNRGNLASFLESEWTASKFKNNSGEIFFFNVYLCLKTEIQILSLIAYGWCMLIRALHWSVLCPLKVIFVLFC